MNDSQIRSAFHTTVLQDAHLCDETVVFNELGLKNGECRADIAVLNGKMIGYEIKTAKDNLTRLASQVISYSKIFDKAFIIVAENHFEKVQNIIPDWWGIYLITATKENYTFTRYRKGKINPSLDAFSIAQLLWKEEALEVATKILNCTIRSNATRQDIYEIISLKCKSKELSKIVMQYLKKREGWRKDTSQKNMFN